MSFQPISLKNGKTIASLSGAGQFINQVSNSKRSAQHWVNAIAEFNSAMAVPGREATTRKALYDALVADKLAL